MLQDGLNGIVPNGFINQLNVGSCLLVGRKYSLHFSKVECMFCIFVMVDDCFKNVSRMNYYEWLRPHIMK